MPYRQWVLQRLWSLRCLLGGYESIKRELKIRPVYTYGPKDVETRLMPKVIKTLLNNQDLKLNSCQSVIDYLYIDDFVKAVESIIDNELQGIYIICSNTENKINKLIIKIRTLNYPNLPSK
jgi:dTDP-D-glucose 4,6-dehydratase